MRATLLLVAGALVVGRATARQDDTPWREYDGHQWASFAPKEKQAYVAGFLAGAGLAAAEVAAGAAADSGRLHAVLDSLARAGGLHFGYGHMVYANQLDEFYWWENRVPIRLYLALRDINDGMRRGLQR